MAQLHWLVPLACVLLSWLDVATDVFAITQYAALAKQPRTPEWRCSDDLAVSAWTKNAAAQRQHQHSPFMAPTCTAVATSSSSSGPGASIVFRSPPYTVAFWLCLYITAGLLVAHVLCQVAIAMWAVLEARKAGFGDECDGCGPILPYITAAARGLVLLEPAYQSLCAYSPLGEMNAEERDLYTRHAQKVFIRSRLAEVVFKGPCVTVAGFALLLQIIAFSSGSHLYTPLGAFSSSRGVAQLPLIASVLSVALGVISLVVFCSAYAVSQRQSLWGCAKPVQTRGWGKTAAYVAATGAYCACSTVCRALAVAAAIASIMLDDNIGRPTYYLVIGSLVTLFVVGCLLYSYCCMCSRQGLLLDCMACVRGAYCSFVSSFVVNMPWNTSAAIYHHAPRAAGAAPSGNVGGRSSNAASVRERRWWPAMAFTLVAAVALLGTGLVLSLLVGSRGTCYAACGGHVNAQGWPLGYVFFSVPCGLFVAVLAAIEVLMFVLLSRTAPKRKLDDDWDDEFIELDPHVGKVPL